MARNLPKAQRIETMRRAWTLAVAGTPQIQIATELAISQSQVSRYLAAMAKRAADRLSDTVTTYAILSLSQTDSVFHEAMKAFERSTKPKKKATRKTSPDGSAKGGSTLEGATVQEVTEREGDPAWLGTGMAAIRLRHELLDRFAPPASKDADDDQGVDTIAGALLEAERRNAEFESHQLTPEPTEVSNP